MNKTFFAFFALLAIGISCKKSSSDTPAVVYSYMSITAGSSWQYSLTNNATSTTLNYSLTSTSRDTLAAGRSYHVFTNSNGNTSEYYAISGSDYYTFRTLGIALGNSQFESLYLKDNAPAGTSWSQSINLTVPGVPLPVPLTITYTIAEKGISRTVNNVAYTDVIHVTTAISSALIPPTALTTDIHNYYARKTGLIENTNKLNLNFMGIAQSVDTKTILLSSDIK